METIEDRIRYILENIQDIAENDELEFKGAKGGLPGSLWETYSAFANTNGGIIILGIKEKKGRFSSDGLTASDIDKLQKDLWSGLSNRTIVNINLLNNDDVKRLEFNGSYILIIRVPRAGREQRPVHIGLDPYDGTYRRRYEGDFKCYRNEVQRMFADANITHSTDKQILKGFSFDDIDKESLRQYRQLFNIAKPDHIWSTLDDLSFLKQLGAYRRDRTTGDEGFTIGGILMLGKYNSITDDECLPNFFPDFRNETSFVENDSSIRWIDRIYPDGTWEANLFQFYLRTLPRLQSFLPKPFSLSRNQRIDQSPAHVAIREVFVNLCVHSDYKAEGSLTVIFRNGTYSFSNPGTMLVSKEQFFEGGESICRNPTLQKMFMLLGPAEKAGSGGAKIMEGWRKYNWKTPTISERTKPDKVEFILSMQSLMQPQIVEELNKRLGIQVSSLSSQAQTILALALTEKYITNERLRYVLRIHKSDLTSLLQNLCRQGLLKSNGHGRGTKYELSGLSSQTEANVDSSASNVDSSAPNVDSSAPNVDSSAPNVDSSASNVDSSAPNVDSSAPNVDRLTFPNSESDDVANQRIQSLLNKMRLNHAEMAELVFKVAADWLTIQELTLILKKDKSYLRNHVLPRLISNGILEREYPSIPNHPNQRYRAKH